MIQIKKLLAILIIFVLTTGFIFTPILERCADYKTSLLPDFNRTAEYKLEKKPETEIREMKKKRSELSEKCRQSKEIKNRRKLSSECVGLNAFMFKYSEYNSIKIRDIKPSENEKKYKSFIKQPLKKKIKLSDYENNYSNCIKEQEFNPKLFDAKY